ncbi:MAG: Gfo/Idh/MocA family oxidoreductase [Edaphobacter sp.]
MLEVFGNVWPKRWPRLRIRPETMATRGEYFHMSGRIKCGVLGAGWWATFAHIPALLAHPAAELVAIQKRDPKQARKVADDFGIPFACTTAEELFAIRDLQAVVISSSPNLHYEQALGALKRGLHVLLEKPMTMTAAESELLVQMADERGLQFLVSCPWHYTVHGVEARRLVRNGVLGPVRMTSVLMTNPISHLLRGSSRYPTHGAPYLLPQEGTYSDPAISGGGQGYAQVSHAAAYLSFLTGARPTEVFARFHNDGAVVDLYDAINWKMSDGSIVSLASTGSTPTNRRDFEVRVFGTEGILFLDLWRGRMELVPMESEPLRYPDLQEAQIYPHSAPALNLIDSILDPLVNGSPAALGSAAMQVVEAAYRSASSGENIVLSLTPGVSL